MTRRLAVMILTGSGLALAAPPPEAAPPKLINIYRFKLRSGAPAAPFRFLLYRDLFRVFSGRAVDRRVLGARTRQASATQIPVGTFLLLPPVFTNSGIRVRPWYTARDR